MLFPRFGCSSQPYTNEKMLGVVDVRDTSMGNGKGDSNEDPIRSN